jgi:hypothetical protein
MSISKKINLGIILTYVITITSVAYMNITSIATLEEDFAILKDIAWGEAGQIVLDVTESALEKEIADLHLQKATVTMLAAQEGSIISADLVKGNHEANDKDIACLQRKLDVLKERRNLLVISLDHIPEKIMYPTNVDITKPKEWPLSDLETEKLLHGLDIGFNNFLWDFEHYDPPIFRLWTRKWEVNAIHLKQLRGYLLEKEVRLVIIPEWEGW